MRTDMTGPVQPHVAVGIGELLDTRHRYRRHRGARAGSRDEHAPKISTGDSKNSELSTLTGVRTDRPRDSVRSSTIMKDYLFRQRPPSKDACQSDRKSPPSAATCRPDVLTNADLEKMVETNDEWILTAPESPSATLPRRTIATSDLATLRRQSRSGTARHCRLRTGRDPGLHRHAGHAVPLHRLPGAAQPRRQQSLGLRPDCGLQRFRLRTDHRRQL